VLVQWARLPSQRVTGTTLGLLPVNFPCSSYECFLEKLVGRGYLRVAWFDVLERPTVQGILCRHMSADIRNSQLLSARHAMPKNLPHWQKVGINPVTLMIKAAYFPVPQL